MSKSLEQRIEEAVREEIALAPYDPAWPALFEEEAANLRRKFPGLVKRIEHIGSTAVPGLAAKPVIDVLIEVTTLDEARLRMAPALASEGYDYFWRTDVSPPYVFLIKRDAQARRTHHLHVMEADSVLWDRLYFRDYLRAFPEEARRYEALKRSLSETHPRDRAAYTEGKTAYVVAVMEKARRRGNTGIPACHGINPEPR